MFVAIAIDRLGKTKSKLVLMVPMTKETLISPHRKSLFTADTTTMVRA